MVRQAWSGEAIMGHSQMGVQLKRGRREEGLGKIALFLGDSSGQGSAPLESVGSFSPVLGCLGIDLSLAQAFFPT